MLQTFAILNIHESLITAPHPYLYHKFAIFIFANGIIFTKFVNFPWCNFPSIWYVV